MRNLFILNKGRYRLVHHAATSLHQNVCINTSLRVIYVLSVLVISCYYKVRSLQLHGWLILVNKTSLFIAFQLFCKPNRDQGVYMTVSVNTILLSKYLVRSKFASPYTAVKAKFSLNQTCEYRCNFPSDSHHDFRLNFYQLEISLEMTMSLSLFYSMCIADQVALSKLSPFQRKNVPKRISNILWYPRNHTESTRALEGSFLFCRVTGTIPTS